MARPQATVQLGSAAQDGDRARADDASIDAALSVKHSLWQRVLMVPWVGVLVFIIALCAYLSIEYPTIFPTQNNLSLVGIDFSYIAIAALGSAIVLVGGGIDLSLGSTMGLVGLFTAEALTNGWPLGLCIALGLGVGALIGIVNAFMITYIRLLPFIVTLGMLSALRGLATGIPSGQIISPPSDFNGTTFNAIGQNSWGPIPISIFLLLGLALLCHFFLNNTTWGRHIYAVGGNENAARLLGIKVNRVKWTMYIIAGLLSAVGGMVLTARLGSALPNNGQGDELICIASAVIGGASLTGGEGSIFGVVIGAALLALIQNALEIMGWGNYWQDLVIGSVILLAVAVDQLRRRLRRT
jgi:ribose transport system permease protein